MGDLVTAFPLPPGYYLLAQGEEEEVERAVDRIQKMKPPPPPGEDLTCFGVVLKVGRDTSSFYLFINSHMHAPWRALAVGKRQAGAGDRAHDR